MEASRVDGVRRRKKLKFISAPSPHVSINLELSLSWMFRARRILPVGGDAADLTERNLATPSFVRAGSSSVAPASQHRRATSASARDKGDDDTSPSSSQAARNLFIASSEAWDCPAQRNSPDAFASTVLLRASSTGRAILAVPSPSSSKVAARRAARVRRARLRGCGEAIALEGRLAGRRASGSRTLQL